LSDFDAAFTIVWWRENGGPNIAVSNDPHDPGGYTRGGVALKYQSGMTKAQLDALDMPGFKAIYRTYWDRAKGDDLAWPLNLVVFDGEFNQGANGARALQSVLGVKTDGDIGPITLRAAAKHDPLDLALRVTIARDTLYRSNSNYALEGTGWLIRIFRNLYDAGLSDARRGDAFLPHTVVN
jgi:lysozyme family protein